MSNLNAVNKISKIPRTAIIRQGRRANTIWLSEDFYFFNLIFFRNWTACSPITYPKFKNKVFGRTGFGRTSFNTTMPLVSIFS